MADEKERFFDGSTILTIIVVIVCIPYCLCKILTGGLSDVNKLLWLIASIPVLICAVFFIGILLAFPFVLMFVCFRDGPFLFGLMIAFYIFLAIKCLIDRIRE